MDIFLATISNRQLELISFQEILYSENMKMLFLEVIQLVTRLMQTRLHISPTHRACHMINKIFAYLQTCYHFSTPAIRFQACHIYLVFKFLGQVVQHCQSCSNLTHGWQSAYDMLHVHLTFRFRRRLAHEARGVRLKTVCIHLREVDRCVLTGTRKYDHGK